MRRTAWAYTGTLAVTFAIVNAVASGWYVILAYGFLLAAVTLPVAGVYALAVWLVARKISLVKAAVIVGGAIPVLWFVGLNWPAFGPDYSIEAFMESGLNPTMMTACAAAWAVGVFVARRQQAAPHVDAPKS